MLNKTKVFIDGSYGTTGLRIQERLARRSDLDILSISEEKRKDIISKKEVLNRSDIVFLCLPDEAAKESVKLVENDKTVIIDASTAHRTDKSFVYGFPEISGVEEIANSKRIAVPGCHAGGVVSIIFPLIKHGILPKNYPLVCFSNTGYSGGGNKMIEKYENGRNADFIAPIFYALGQEHKHLPEIKYVCGLEKAPFFQPAVCNFYSGMCVEIPLFSDLLAKKTNLNDIRMIYKEFYKKSPIISYQDYEFDTLPSNLLSGRDSMVITAKGNDNRIALFSVFDNLGKGASGAAIQCMNLVMGIKETTSLIL